MSYSKEACDGWLRGALFEELAVGALGGPDAPVAKMAEIRRLDFVLGRSDRLKLARSR